MGETDTMAVSLSQSTSTASNSKSNQNTKPNDTDLEFNLQRKIEDMEQELLKPQQENTYKERTPTKTQIIFWLCRLRRGFSECHLAHLYGVAQSTIRRLFVPSFNFMYLKFGQVCIWPSNSVVQTTMPADFKEKFPSTRLLTVRKSVVKCQAVYF